MVGYHTCDRLQFPLCGIYNLKYECILRSDLAAIRVLKMDQRRRVVQGLHGSPSASTLFLPLQRQGR